MRKKILLVLIGFILGIGIFINFENLNPLYVLLAGGVSCLIFYLFDKKYALLPIALIFGFSISLMNFEQFKLKEAHPKQIEISILEKRGLKEGYRYFVRAVADGIDEKSVVFAEEDYEIGDMLLISGEVSLPNRNTNPNLFNYRNYLISKGIASTIKFDHVYKKANSSSKLLALRRSFYNYIHDLFGLNLRPQSADFVISVVLGENLIDNDEIKDLGLAHILAVSGLHMDLLFAFVLFIFRKINLNYKLGYSISLGLCLIYGYVIGFPFSVIRVLIIYAISFLAFLLEEPEDKIKSMLVAAFLILLFNPFAILNAGFVLSFVATSGVYLVWPKFKDYLREGLISESIGFTGAIQAALLPFTAYYYGKINLISILANFIIVPIFTIAMYLIFGLIFLYPIFKILLRPVFLILDYLVYSLINMTSLLAKISFLSFYFAHPSIFIVIYLYVLILVCLYIKKENKSLVKRLYGLSLVILIASLGYDFLTPELSFSMIDIGQGDAFLLNDGGDYYLFDVGGPKYKDYDSGERILLPYLKSLGVKNINGVFISHGDSDHAGNMDLLNENFNVENVITSPYNLADLRAFDPEEMRLNDRIKLKNGSVTCVFEGIEATENSKSLGLLIEINGIKILTLGDLEMEFEDKLDIAADILKVSHHGSRSSTSRSFVEKVNPKIALISAGRNNTYGHPSREVIDNLDGVKIYNSKESGMVKIYFEDKLRIESYLKGGYFR